jgi:hypothetical protein
VSKLVKVSQRMYVDINKVSFIDLSKRQDTHGPAYMQAKVIVGGCLVILGDSESEELIKAMKAGGLLE